MSFSYIAFILCMKANLHPWYKGFNLTCGSFCLVLSFQLSESLHSNVHGNINVFGLAGIDLLRCCCCERATPI